MASDNNGMDMKAAEKTFDSFMGLVKWGTIITIAVTALVVLIIAN